MAGVLHIRYIDEKVARRFRSRAALYGMTQGEYLALLVDRDQEPMPEDLKP